MTEYEVPRGAPLVIGDFVRQGVVLAGHSMRARMKPEKPGMRGVMPGDNVPAVDQVFISSHVTNASVNVNGQQLIGDAWLHSLTEAQTQLLPAASYLFDSSLLLDGKVISTSRPVRVIIREAASASLA